MPDISVPIANLASQASTSDQVGAIMVGVKGLVVAYWPLIIVPAGLFLAMLLLQFLIDLAGHKIADD